VEGRQDEYYTTLLSLHRLVSGALATIRWNASNVVRPDTAGRSSWPPVMLVCRCGSPPSLASRAASHASSFLLPLSGRVSLDWWWARVGFMGVVVWMRVFGGASFVRWSRSRLLPASRILLPSGRVPPSSGIRALGVRASSRHPTRALNHDHPSSHLDAITTPVPADVPTLQRYVFKLGSAPLLRRAGGLGVLTWRLELGRWLLLRCSRFWWRRSWRWCRPLLPSRSVPLWPLPPGCRCSKPSRHSTSA
jgi:hypothetical protein